MPKPINPTIGHCPCSIRGCDHSAEVKKEKGSRKRLYLVCRSHGVINLSGRAFQEFILENSTMGPGGAEPVPARVPETAQNDIEHGPAPVPYPVQIEQPKPKPKPAQTPAPSKPSAQQPKRGPFRPLGWLTDGLDEL